MRRTRAMLAGIALIGGALALSLPANASTKPSTTAHASSSSTITIGSTTIDEQQIIAWMYDDVLTNAGYKVSMRPSVATREDLFPAFKSGAVDLYPDYAGSLLIYLNNEKNTPAANQISTDVPALKTALSKDGGTVLAPAQAVDVNVFAVTAATAKKDKLTTLSSLKPYAKNFVLGGPSECPQRPLCEEGLKSLYGLKFKSFVSTDESGPLSVEALKDNRAQVVEFFSSYVDIKTNHFVELTDNKHLQPADHLIPVIKKSIDSTKVANLINAISAKLTTAQLSSLNAKFYSSAKPGAQKLATAWLKMEHLG